jgi:hypothetical protein
VILLLALAGGLAVGVARSRWRGTAYQPPHLRLSWLAFLAFLPQFFVLYLPNLREHISDWFSSACLIASLMFFLGFAWLNRHLAGMSILLVGLVLNLMAMTLNGGFMPISPQTAAHLISEKGMLDYRPGDRLGTKDILLLPEHTRLEWLADRFLTPAWTSYRAAFSLGDVLIAIGAFSILAWTGEPVHNINKYNNRGVSI